MGRTGKIRQPAPIREYLERAYQRVVLSALICWGGEIIDAAGMDEGVHGRAAGCAGKAEEVVNM